MPSVAEKIGLEGNEERLSYTLRYLQKILDHCIISG